MSIVTTGNGGHGASVIGPAGPAQADLEQLALGKLKARLAREERNQ